MKFSTKLFMMLFVLCCMMATHSLPLFAGTCSSKVLELAINDENNKLMTTMSWMGNHQIDHYICDYNTQACKVKYALLLTAMTTDKTVAYKYTNQTCGNGENLTGVHPDEVRIITE